MTNPNNNKNFNDEALRINRALKKDNDAMWAVIDEVEDYFLSADTSFEDNVLSTREIQDMIYNLRSRDAM